MTGAAMVTGATSGIGRALALELARRGFPLLLVARDGDRLRAVAAGAEAAGSPEVAIQPADLTDKNGLHVVSERIADIDFLVNAAGCGTTRTRAATGTSASQLNRQHRFCTRPSHQCVGLLRHARISS